MQKQALLPIGTIVQGRYLIEDVLGKGGFGAVYLVRDQRVRQNRFALKELVDPDRREHKHFFFEAKLLQRLNHPALPQVDCVFEDERLTRAYMLMDYVEGQNLETLRRRQPEKRFFFPQVLTIMAPIMDAVSYLHNQQPPIIHRDIKPSNIIVTASGKTVLVDFGIAKECDPDATTTAVRHGSPGYAAPEQYGSGTNPRTDIYGLGATIYTLLTGVVPTEAFYRVTRLASGRVDPLDPLNKLASSVPSHITDAVHHAMSVNASDRFSSVEQFGEALWALHTVAGKRLSFVPGNTPSVSSPLPVVAQHEQAVEAAPTPSFKEKPPVERPSISLSRRLGALILVVLLIGLSVGVGFWSQAPHHRAAYSAPPTPTITLPTPTTTSGIHSTVAETYKGNLYDLPLNVNRSISLVGVQQSHGSISGYFILGSKLQGSGPFRGTFNTTKQLQFTVTDTAGHATLFLEGIAQSSTSLSGDYYRCSQAQGSQCNQSYDDYGIWSVVLVS